MNDDQTILDRELVELFGHEIVNQAQLVDVADLNLDEKMIACISTGVTRLKQLRNNPGAQQKLLAAMGPGEQLLLCMWVMEMDLLDKIRGQSD